MVSGLESRLLLAIDFSSLRAIGGTDTLVARGVAIDSAGNSYVTGNYSGLTSLDGSANGKATGTTDVFLAKFTASGQGIWFRHFGNPVLPDGKSAGSSGGEGVAVDSAGNVYFTGFFSGTLDFDPGPGTRPISNSNRIGGFVAKLDTNGNFGATSYVRPTSEPEQSVTQGLSIAVDAAGNAVVGGRFRTGTMTFNGGTVTAVALQEAWVAKLTPTGGFTYLKSFTGTAGAIGGEARGVTIDTAGNAYLVGTFSGITAFSASAILTSTPQAGGGSSADAFVVKLNNNPTGTVAYAKAFGGAANDVATSVAADAAGNVVIVGRFAGTASFAPLTIATARAAAVYVARLSPTGGVAYAQAFDALSTAALGDSPAVVLDRFGRTFVAGSFSGTGSIGGVPVQSAGSTDVFLAKLGSGGGVESVKTAGGTGSDAATALAVNAAGQLALTGPAMPPATFGAGVLTSAGANNLFVAQALDIVVTPPPGGKNPPGDFDGDKKTDLAAFDPTSATFFIQQSTGPVLTQQFGIPNGLGLPIGGDFDGDGKTDSAFFDPTTATYYIRYSNPAFNGGSRVQQFGVPNGQGFMNPGDFDGDGKTDEAVFDPVEAKYYIRYSNPAFNGGSRVQQFGVPNGKGVMVPGDYDGDKKTDEAVFDPVEAKYYIRYSNPAFNGGSRVLQFGVPNGVNQFVAGDFDGDGKTDETVFDPVEAKYYIRYSNPAFNGGSRVLQFGVPNGKGIMVAGDYDGDGKTDEAVYDPPSGTFYIRFSAGGSLIKQFGPTNGSGLPVPAVVRPGSIRIASSPLTRGADPDFVAIGEANSVVPPLPRSRKAPRGPVIHRFGSGN